MEDNASFNKPCRQSYERFYSMFYVFSQSFTEVQQICSRLCVGRPSGLEAQRNGTAHLFGTRNTCPGSGPQWEGLCGVGSSMSVFFPPSHKAHYTPSIRKQLLSIPTISACWYPSSIAQAQRSETTIAGESGQTALLLQQVGCSVR